MVEKRNVYKGHRYVPKIFGVWNQLESYEGLSVVTWEGKSFTSKKRVPSGVDINNEEFWVVTGNYNEQVEQYRQEVSQLKTETTEEINNNAFITNPYVSVEQFGAIGDYDSTAQTGTDNSNAFKRAIEKAKLENKVLLIPDKVFYHSENIEYPNKVKMIGSVRGGTVIFNQQKDGIYENLDVDNLHLSGIWRAKMDIQRAANVLMDASVNWYGTYWNRINIGIVTEELVIDISEGAVNQSVFTGGRIGKLRITGTQDKYGWECQAQNNYFNSIDISSGGAIQDDEKGDTNYLVACYSEAAKGTDLIKGNWMVLANTGDKTPTPSLRNHILLSNDAVPASSQDFMSMSSTNLVEGGEWQSLDEKGRPKGLKLTSLSGTVIKDQTAPDGSGRALKLTTVASWASLNIVLPNPLTNGGSLLIYLKGDTPVSFEAQHPTGVLNMPNTKIALNDDWYLYRVVVPKGNITRINIYFLTSAFIDKTSYISGVKLSPYKTGLLPYFDNNNYCKGATASIPTEGIWRLGEFVMNNNNTTNPDVNGWRCVNLEPLTFKAF